MKKEVNICDICDERVSKIKCVICDKDTCIYCGKLWNVKLNYECGLTLSFCNKCLKCKYDKDILDSIKKEISDKLRKGKIIQGLK